MSRFVLFFVFLSILGCSKFNNPERSRDHYGKRPKILKNSVIVKIVMQEKHFYHVLIKEEGKIKPYVYHISKIVFVDDVKPEENMWAENDPNEHNGIIVHIRNIKDIQLISSER